MLIVDPWQNYVFCTRSGVTDAPFSWCSTCAVCAGAGYTRCCDHTSVHLCASSLQNLAVPQKFILLPASLWNYLGDPVFDGGFQEQAGSKIGGFQEQGQCLFIGLAASCLFVSYRFPFLLSHSMGWLWSWGLRTDRVLIAL